MIKNCNWYVLWLMIKTNHKSSKMLFKEVLKIRAMWLLLVFWQFINDINNIIKILIIIGNLFIIY